MTDGSFRLACALFAACALASCSQRDPSHEGVDPVSVAAPPAEAPSEARLAPEDVTQANALAYARQPARTDWHGGNVARGAELYQESCWICHGASGQGSGPAAASLNPKPRDFRDGRFYIDANDDDVTGEPIDLARVILVGAAPFGGSEDMQAWHARFTEGEVRDLVAYVRSLSEGRPRD